MNDEVYHVPTGYLHIALIHGIDTTRTFLKNIHHNNDNYQLSSTTRKPAPDGSHIITHPEKLNSTILTNFVISMEDEHAYAMLATPEGPIRTQLRTLICIRGNTHSQVIHMQFNPHTRSILGRTYHINCSQHLAHKSLHPISPSRDTTKTKTS